MSTTRISERLRYTYRRYDTLKKYVYQLEKQQAGLREIAHDLEANEQTSLMGGQADNMTTDALFIPQLDRELKKISLFYESQESQLLDEVRGLQELVRQQEDYGPDVGHQYESHGDDDDDDEEDDDFDLHSPEVPWPRSPVSRRRRSLSESNGYRGTPTLH